MSQIQISDSSPSSAPITEVAKLKVGLDTIQHILKYMMVQGVDYGAVPGTSKPTLLKAGAEKILVAFRIAVHPTIEDLSTPDEARYRVTCRGVSILNGADVGCGIGEASSNETKWAWRAAVCDAEWDQTPETHRRLLWKRGTPAYCVRQIRTSPADMANTVLKMAKKRAMVDLCLTCTAASAMFEQDLDEMPELVENAEQPATPEPRLSRPSRRTQDQPQPQSVSEEAQPEIMGARMISDGQRRRLYALYKSAGRTDEEVKAYLMQTYGIASSRDIPVSVYEEICEWASQKPAG